MFTRLTVQDFQSVAAADLELAAFTVIVGDNRSGKTALLRALRNVITNKTGQGFIRRGKAKCVVTVETAEGDVITWEKTKSTATYDLNGQSYSKMAGSVPEEIKEALGVREVVVDNTLTLTPQLALTSGDNLFLVDKSPGQVARALAKLTRLDVVVKAQVLCKTFIRQIKGELKAIQDNIGRTSEELDEFTGLDAEGKTLAKVETSYQSIMADLRYLARVDEELRAYNDGKAELSRRIDPNAHVSLPIDIECVEDAVRLTLALVEVPPEIEPIELTDDIERLNKANGWCMNYEHSSETAGLADIHYKELSAEEASLGDAINSFTGEICPVCGGTL